MALWFRHLLSERLERQEWRFTPGALAFAPVLSLLAFWLADEAGLIATAIGLPLLALLVSNLRSRPGAQPVDPVTKLPNAAQLEQDTALCIEDTRKTDTHSALFLLEMSDLANIRKNIGTRATHAILERLAVRLRRLLPGNDRLYAPCEGRFAVLMEVQPEFVSEEGVQLAVRLQALAEEPLSHQSKSLFSGCSVGLCLSAGIPEASSGSLLRGAELALHEALSVGTSSIRVFNKQLEEQAERFNSLTSDVKTALFNGEIQPYFQPQIRTDTGEVIGVEALARWVHPRFGVLSPAEFFPALQAEGLMRHLCSVMVSGAVKAFAHWGTQNLPTGVIAVNLDAEDLSDPTLADQIIWELDRQSVEPARLALEILETVITLSSDGPQTQNLKRLSGLGCRIDLDDFGIGHASLGAIRRFGAERIKLDRSFVSQIDKDTDQQRMVSAILTMADRLGLDTLAEGIETPAEQDALAQLGCVAVQGFGIAPPMAIDEYESWLIAHHAQRPELTQQTR